MTNERAKELLRQVLANEHPKLMQEILKRRNNPIFISSDAIYAELLKMTDREANKYLSKQKA